MITLIDSTGARHEGLELTLSMPQRGNWTGHVQTGEDTAPSGPVTIEIARDGEPGVVDRFVGFARYGDAWQGRADVAIVGGAGNLTQDLPPRHYARGSSRIAALILAADIASAAKEVLDDGAAATLDALQLGQWTRTVAPGTVALGLLADEFGLSWRVLDTGKIWFGPETWPSASAVDYAFEANQRPDDRAIDIAPDRATLRPGVTVLGQRIVRVVYTVTGAGIRATLYYGESERDEMISAMRARLPPVEYGLSYRAVVVAQHADDNTIDVRCEDAVGNRDPRLPDLRRIPYRGGLAGARAHFRAGDVLSVAFDGGDPSGAFACSAETSSKATKAVARAGDPVDCGWWKVNGSGALVASSEGDAGAVHITGTIPSGSSEVFLR